MLQLQTNYDKITSPRLKELFNSKVEHLSNTLLLKFDTAEVDALVIIKGEENKKRLLTKVIVECDNKDFKTVLETHITLYAQ